MRTKGKLSEAGAGRVGVGDERFQIAGQPPLPERFVKIRQGQARALDQIRAEFDRGSRVVFVDAPTGSGKSLLGELVRRDLQVERGLYVCTTKSLQAQFAHDFPYAKVLKGSANYLPSGVSGMTQALEKRAGLGRITCADCDRGPGGDALEDQTCSWCEEVIDCPYQTAKRDALVAPIGVLNTAYALAEWNNVGRWGRRELVIADESDLLESTLMGFVELRVPKRWVEAGGLTVPKKGSHLTTIWRWMEEELLPGLQVQMGELRKHKDVESRRLAGRLERLVGEVERVIKRPEGWVRDNDSEGDRSADGLVLKPVSVEDVAGDYLWKHGEKWLCMTGTLVSADMEAESLGLEEAGIPWGVVEMGMEFPVENRPVRYVPVGAMTRKDQEATLPKMLGVVERILTKHDTGNVLIHTHTYKLAGEVTEWLRRGQVDVRPVLTYASARDRDEALAMFKRGADTGGSILVASSMDRGVDLPGELCRVQIIVKMPMANLGDRQVSERLRAKGGQVWYLANTVRTVMQMTGRAVRAVDDWAVTYVLDSHFSKVYGDGKRLGMWPDWWVEGLEVERVREWT